METGFVALLVLSVIGGIVVGVFLGQQFAHRRYLRETKYTQGTLNVDCDDPEFDPGLFLGLAIPVKDVTSLKYITLDVNVISQNSHK